MVRNFSRPFRPIRVQVHINILKVTSAWKVSVTTEILMVLLPRKADNVQCDNMEEYFKATKNQVH